MSYHTVVPNFFFSLKFSTSNAIWCKAFSTSNVGSLIGVKTLSIHEFDKVPISPYCSII